VTELSSTGYAVLDEAFTRSAVEQTQAPAAVAAMLPIMAATTVTTT
jgi:hypothetical protein